MNQDILTTINKLYKIIEIREDSKNIFLFDINMLDKVK